MSRETQSLAAKVSIESLVEEVMEGLADHIATNIHGLGENKVYEASSERGMDVTDSLDHLAENAMRAVECVNAMRGWSAPEGAVDELVRWAKRQVAHARSMNGADNDWSRETGDLLSKFKPVVEAEEETR